MNESKIEPYIEPIYRFCVKRLANREDAADLAQEILTHALHGLTKYNIDNFDAWLWRIAHNRYARFISSRSQRLEIALSTNLQFNDYDIVDQLILLEEHQNVFRALHTLAASYRTIVVDYYVNELSIKEIARKNQLATSTVKWRLHVSREQIKGRIDNMKKVYGRISWNTGTCNGKMDPDRYLHSQIARAICQAAYEKPATVEEISLATGLPTMYIEDELERLIYGDAITKKANKFFTNFIILSLTDNQRMLTKFQPLTTKISDLIYNYLQDNYNKIQELGFYKSDSGIEKLGYILVPLAIRHAINDIQQTNQNLKYGPYPPRKDGGYGWFIVQETVNEHETIEPSASGCNLYYDSQDHSRGMYCYYWLGKTFSYELYQQGMNLMFSKSLFLKPDQRKFIDELEQDDLVKLIKLNLVKRVKNTYHLTIPVFSKEQFTQLTLILEPLVEQLVELLNDLVNQIWQEFRNFVPEQVQDQINQYLAGYVQNITGLVIEAMIRKDQLKPPPQEGALTYNVFIIEELIDYNI